MKRHCNNIQSPQGQTCCGRYQLIPVRATSLVQQLLLTLIATQQSYQPDYGGISISILSHHQTITRLVQGDIRLAQQLGKGEGRSEGREVMGQNPSKAPIEIANKNQQGQCSVNKHTKGEKVDSTDFIESARSDARR